jgi:methylmalonyl-CoA mutase
MYPNMGEDVHAPSSVDKEWIADRMQAAGARRPTGDLVREAALERLSQSRGPAADCMERAVAAADAGATLNQLMEALGAKKGPSNPVVEPIPGRRDAAPFEELRLAMSVHSARHGAPEPIFLANMGPVAQYKARSDFSAGFFQVGGFEIINPDGFATPEAAADGALASGARAVVICSTDSTYAQIVPPLVAHIKQMEPTFTIILAGYPKDQVDSLRAAGVDEFIHLGADCVEINRRLQEKLGIIEEEVSA